LLRAASPINDRAEDDSRWVSFVIWSSVLVFIVCVLIGASGGVRGSDQYWYLDDTETLVSGGEHFSNSLFPRQLLAEGIERSPFIHDILPQRAVVPVARLIGPFWAWIGMNAVAMLIGAALTFIAVRRVSDSAMAAWAAALLLLLPLSVFCATQVLVETSLVPLFAATALLIQRPAGPFKYFGLALVLTLGLMSRITVLPLLLLLPLVPLFESIPVRRRLALAALSAVMVAIGVGLNRWIFAGIPIPGNPLAFGINGRGLSLWLSTDPVVLTFDSVISKLRASAMSLTEGSTGSRILTATSWLLMLTAAGGAFVAWRGVHRSHRLIALFVVVVLFVTVATLGLYQNQVRYVLPAYPVLLLSTAMLFSGRERARAPWRGRGVLLTASIVVLVPLAFANALMARAEGVREQAGRAEVIAAAADLRGEGDIILVAGNDQMFAHCLRPRTVLFLREDQPASEWARILAMPRWRWVACRPEVMDQLAAAGVRGKIVRVLEHRGESLAVLELPDRPGRAAETGK